MELIEARLDDTWPRSDICKFISMDEWISGISAMTDIVSLSFICKLAKHILNAHDMLFIFESILKIGRDAL